MGLRPLVEVRPADAPEVPQARRSGAARHSNWSLVVPLLQAAKSHRTTGHAAEMAFFAVLTLVPSTVAVGSALGLSKVVIGERAIADAENAATGAVRAIMGPDLADGAISPFVHAQLAQPRGGVAIGGLLVAWWLSMRLFEATGHALDSAYNVTDRRPTFVSHCLALAFALGSVLLVALTVQVMVMGPLGDPSSGPASSLGIGGAYASLWSVGRWPVLLAIVVGFLSCLYRYSPNVPHCWRECLPGAVVGAVLHDSAGVAADDPGLSLIGQSVNAVVATVLWAYLASVAILMGGEFNAMLRRRASAVRWHEAVSAPAAPASSRSAARPAPARRS
jgi:membrane protein